MVGHKRYKRNGVGCKNMYGVIPKRRLKIAQESAEISQSTVDWGVALPHGIFYADWLRYWAGVFALDVTRFFLHL